MPLNSESLLAYCLNYPPEWDIDGFIKVCRQNIYNPDIPAIPTSPEAREESDELLDAASLFPSERG